LKILVLGNFPESTISFRGPLLREFVKAGHEVIACAPGECGDVPERLKSMGVTYRSIRLHRTGANPLVDIVDFILLLQMIRELRPDIVLCYTIKPIIYGSMAAWLGGVRRIFSIVTGIGYVFTGNSLKQRLLRPLVRWLYRAALSRNQKIFFLNQDDRDTFCHYGIIKNEETNIYIHGEGIDLEEFSPGPGGGRAASFQDSGVVLAKYVDDTSTRVPDGKCSFLLIGRLIKDKGIVEYVEAARILSAKYENLRFQLLGPFDSNPTAISKHQIDEWQWLGSIEYLGETRDVRPFISGCNVFVLPSYREGLPRTVLEAMSMGRPIVTTEAPGCRETVTEGENGFLVPVKNSGALAAAMEKFILQPELIEQLGRRSREIAEERYDVRKVNAVILKAIGLLDEKTA
jgi:glycosyltransferase involved in cell wall biosynthesis